MYHLQRSKYLKYFSPKVKITKLDVGPFTLASSTGNIEPKKSTTINVTCKPKQLGDIEELILIHVSDAPPPYKKGIILKLSVKSVIPHIDLDDIENIFKEQIVVNSLDDLICDDQVNLIVFQLFRYVHN